jgi:hypothetical protein
MGPQRTRTTFGLPSEGGIPELLEELRCFFVGHFAVALSGQRRPDCWGKLGALRGDNNVTRISETKTSDNCGAILRACGYQRFARDEKMSLLFETGWEVVAMKSRQMETRRKPQAMYVQSKIPPATSEDGKIACGACFPLLYVY